MPHLTLTFLGAFQAHLDGAPLTNFHSVKVQALLAYLVVEADRPHTRETLMALLWPDDAPQSAQQSLRQALYALRRVLGDTDNPAREPFLLVTRQTIQLNSRSQVTLDVASFLQQVQQGNLAEAVALYSADLLVGLVTDSTPFEEWLRVTREYLHNLALNALGQLTQQRLDNDDYAHSATYARRLLLLDPWREEAHRQLMMALALSGERSAALAQYESCRRVLADELGIEPDQETMTLYEQIRIGKVRDPSIKVTPPSPSILAQTSLLPQPTSMIRQVDWGEAPDVSRFMGRHSELAELRHWLVDERCRLVAVLGMGGQGKTALATMLATQVEHAFDAVVWRSLRNAPPIEELLDKCLRVFSNHNLQEVPRDVDKRITLLLAYLRQQRCLLVLDNYETVLQSERAGYYLPGYEGYGQLLQRIGEGRHQSCLLLSSREKPKEFAPLEGATAPVRSLHLASLHPADGRALLQDRGLAGSDRAWSALHTRYSGHPLALMIVAETIRELFAGEIGEFLNVETSLFGDISDLLAHQLSRLSPLEQELMFWLAVEREGVTGDELRTNLLKLPSKLAVLEALRSLRKRSLVERTETGFTLQNVVLEYLTAQLIERMYDELTSRQPLLFSRYALLKAQAKSYIRESQRRLLLMPLANRLIEQWGKVRAVEQLTAVLAKVRHDQSHQSSYAGGNLLNLLVQLNGDLRGFDFSHLAVWQADLHKVDAQEINFCHADLSYSTFRDTFGVSSEVVFSPTGAHIAAATLNGEVRIWRVQDGEPLLTCTANRSRLRSLCFSPDGRMVASGGDEGIVRLWDVSIALNPSVTSGRCLATLFGHTNDVNGLRFSPDGALLASGSNDNTARLWDVATALNPQGGRDPCRAILKNHRSHVNAVCFNSEGTLLATASNDKTVRLWDIATALNPTSTSHACLYTFHGHTYEVNSLCFSPNGNLLASGSSDQTIRIWAVAMAHNTTNDGAPCLQILEGHTDAVNSIQFNVDGTMLASGSWDQTIRLWDTQHWQCIATLQSNIHGIASICFNPAGTMLAGGSWNLNISLWDVQSLKCITTLQGYTDEVWSICFSPDGQLLASGDWNQRVRLWDVAAALNKDPLHSPSRAELRGHTHFVVSVCFSHDGRLLASGSWDQTIRLWEVETGRCLAVFGGDLGQVVSICFSPDGALLASGGFDHAIRLWDIQKQKLLAVLSGHTGQIDGMCFHPAGKLLATCSHDQTIRLWDIYSGRGSQILQEITPQTYFVCFSPDGTQLATGSRDALIRVWSLESGQCVATLQGHSADAKALCFSPDGRLLASGSLDHTARLWDIQSRRCLATLYGHTDAVKSISFHPDGKVFATGSPDGAIKFWAVETGECLQTLYSDRPYARMNITGITGVSEAQKMTLKILGAMEEV